MGSTWSACATCSFGWGASAGWVFAFGCSGGLLAATRAGASAWAGGTKDAFCTPWQPSVARVADKAAEKRNSRIEARFELEENPIFSQTYEIASERRDPLAIEMVLSQNSLGQRHIRTITSGYFWNRWAMLPQAGSRWQQAD